MNLPLPDSFKVFDLETFRSELVVFAYAYRDPRVMRWNGSAFQSWGLGFPDGATNRSIAIGDTIWAATWEDGLWFRTASDSIWRRQAAPRWIALGLKDSLTNPRGLAWHNGALWVADWASTVTRMPGGRAPYEAVDNCVWDSIQSTSCRRGPVNIFSLLSYGGRLFSAGYFGASPHVLDEARGFWIPMEIAGWCWDNDNVCGGKRTWDMVGLGDTLYSASSRFVMKIPLSQVPVFSEPLMDRFHWPRDTSFRDSLFRRNNPLRP